MDSNFEAARSARALHRVLVKARHIALQESSAHHVAELLDWAGLLADDIASADNRSEQFVEPLQGLGDDHPELAGLLRDYKADAL